MMTRGVAILLAVWMAVPAALLASSAAFGGSRELDLMARPYERAYERVVETIREVERAVRDFFGGGSGSSKGRGKECSCL